MRDIKFRGKSLIKEHWVYGNLIRTPDMTAAYIEDFKSGKVFRVAPRTVGEFTGFTDENGNDIYEGQLIEYRDKYDGFIAEVKLIEGGWYAGVRIDSDTRKLMKIVNEENPSKI